MVMNADPESFLEQLTPHGAGPEVRAQVLARVHRELQATGRVRWTRWTGLAMAASLVLGIVSNAWISWRLEQRLAQLYGPPTLPASVVAIAKDVEAVTDKPTAQWLAQRYAL